MLSILLMTNLPRSKIGRAFSPSGHGACGLIHHHPVGTWGQVLGRGLVPRLSIGTLQLSIRCSSIHFLPSRSFPVSDVGEFKGKVAALDAGGSSGLS